MSNIIVMAFSPRNIIGCLLKKGLQRGVGGGWVTGTPGSPSLRPCTQSCKFLFLLFVLLLFISFGLCSASLVYFFIVFVFQLIASFKVRIWKICDYKHNIAYQLTARSNFPHAFALNTQSFPLAFFMGGGGGGLLFLGSDINNNDSRQEVSVRRK